MPDVVDGVWTFSERKDEGLLVMNVEVGWSSHLLAAVVCRQICSIRPVQKLFWSDGGRSAHAIVIQVGLDSVAAFFSQQDRSIVVEVRLCCANTPSQP